MRSAFINAQIMQSLSKSQVAIHRSVMCILTEISTLFRHWAFKVPIYGFLYLMSSGKINVEGKVSI